jgi:hypothetical protein
MTTATKDGAEEANYADSAYPTPFRGQYVARADDSKEVLEGFNPHVAGEVVVHDGSRTYIQKPASAVSAVENAIVVNSREVERQEYVMQGEKQDELDQDYQDRLEWRRQRRESGQAVPPQPAPLNYGQSQMETAKPVSSYQAVQQDLPVDLSEAGLGFLGLYQPIKPTKQVIFTLPGLGDWTVRFHEVVLTHNAVVLLYDNRYTEGMQFVPASGDATITVRIPSEKTTVLCVSLGLSWSVGCMDCVVLVRKDDVNGEERRDW